MTITNLPWLIVGVIIGILLAAAWPHLRERWPTPDRLRSTIALTVAAVVLAVVMTPVLLWGLALGLWDLAAGRMSTIRKPAQVHEGATEDFGQQLHAMVEDLASLPAPAPGDPYAVLATLARPEHEWVEPETVDDMSALLEQIGVAAEPVAWLTVPQPLVGNPTAYRALHRQVDPYLAVTAVWPTVPAGTDPDQAWFWTPEWQAGEREADEDLAAGRFTRFNSDEEFERYLDEQEAVA
jgi:hypothetical protein